MASSTARERIAYHAASFYHELAHLWLEEAQQAGSSGERDSTLYEPALLSSMSSRVMLWPGSGKMEEESEEAGEKQSFSNAPRQQKREARQMKSDRVDLDTSEEEVATSARKRQKRDLSPVKQTVPSLLPRVQRGNDFETFNSSTSLLGREGVRINRDFGSLNIVDANMDSINADDNDNDNDNDDSEMGDVFSTDDEPSQSTGGSNQRKERKRRDRGRRAGKAKVKCEVSLGTCKEDIV